MTDRIPSQGPQARPVAKLADVAATAAGGVVAAGGAGAATDKLAGTRAAAKALSHAGARVKEPLPLAPLLLAPTLGLDLADWVHHQATQVGSALNDAWHWSKKKLLNHVPFGAWEQLEVTKRPYPDARSAAWKGQPLVSTVGDERECALMRDAARQGLDQGDLGHGAEPDRVKKAREVAAQLMRALTPDERAQVHASREEQDRLVDQAIAITDRVSPPDTPGSKVGKALAAVGTLDGHQGDTKATQAMNALTQQTQQALVDRAVAVRHLPAADRTRVEGLRRRFEDSPVVQDALDGLAASGRLFDKDASGGKTTLDHLEALASGPLDAGIAPHRDAMIGETLLELAEPGSVCQRGRNTCGAAAAQGYLAQTDPAEYVRLVVGLASPEGTVKTANGTAITRDPKWAEQETDGKGDGPGRTTPSRLLQSSLMDISSMGDYDNTTDRGKWDNFTDWLGDKAGLLHGTWPPGEERLLQAITARNFRWVGGSTLAEANDAFADASRRNPVMVLLNYNTDGELQALHWVRVIEHDEANDTYTVLNAQRGTEDTVPGEEFRQRHCATVFADKRPAMSLM